MNRSTRLIGQAALVLCAAIAFVCQGCAEPHRPQSSSGNKTSEKKRPIDRSHAAEPSANPPLATRKVVHATQANSTSGRTSKVSASATLRTARSDDTKAVASRPGRGTLTGRVIFSGNPPTPLKITVTKDHETCGAAAGERHDVVVSASGGLKDVVVEILGVDAGSSSSPWPPADNHYVLRQKNCQFHPRLLVMPAGQKITVFNDDALGHNVNSGQWNEQQPGGGEPIVRPLDGKRPVRIGCNIHSWMEAWVYLARSPYYAVSDADGDFLIENVPPGKYRVTFWHTSLRPARRQVTIEAGQVDRHEVEFKSPYGS